MHTYIVYKQLIGVYVYGYHVCYKYTYIRIYTHTIYTRTYTLHIDSIRGNKVHIILYILCILTFFNNI